METVIYSNDFSLTDASNNHIKQQVKTSMRVCSVRAERIVVRLEDVNGSKGDEGKERCVEVKLIKHAPIVVSKLGSDAYQSIRRAPARASSAVVRKVGRRCALETSVRSTVKLKH